MPDLSGFWDTIDAIGNEHIIIVDASIPDDHRRQLRKDYHENKIIQIHHFLYMMTDELRASEAIENQWACECVDWILKEKRFPSDAPTMDGSVDWWHGTDVFNIRANLPFRLYQRICYQDQAPYARYNGPEKYSAAFKDVIKAWVDLTQYGYINAPDFELPPKDPRQDARPNKVYR